jgi:hypothetical protein
MTHNHGYLQFFDNVGVRYISRLGIGSENKQVMDRIIEINITRQSNITVPKTPINTLFNLLIG